MEQKGKRILLVDDERENIELFNESLARDGHVITSASEGQAALHKLKAWKPHLIVLDINMPGESGLELIPKIRAATTDEYVGIILVTSNMSTDDVMKGLDVGADDYLTKPFRPQELIARVRLVLKLKELHDSLKRASNRIEDLTSSDDLTGLLNMRALFRRGEEEIVRSRRFRKPVSAILVNADQFSSVNEVSGFSFGSEVLRSLGQRIKQCVRSLDLVGRLGADEFFLLLPETDLSGAEFVAERIRDAIQNADFRVEKQSAKLTACIGVAGFNHDRKEGDLAELYKNASEALRSAKSSGPNQIEIYSFA